jgi:hypothetical protein
VEGEKMTDQKSDQKYPENTTVGPNGWYVKKLSNGDFEIHWYKK